MRTCLYVPIHIISSHVFIEQIIYEGFSLENTLMQLFRTSSYYSHTLYELFHLQKQLFVPLTLTQSLTGLKRYPLK